jgi:hypothetical protein
MPTAPSFTAETNFGKFEEGRHEDYAMISELLNLQTMYGVSG